MLAKLSAVPLEMAGVGSTINSGRVIHLLGGCRRVVGHPLLDDRAEVDGASRFVGEGLRGEGGGGE